MTVEPLLADSQAKLRASLELVFASAATYTSFSPGHIYPPLEREPYDALSDLFLRAFESSLEFIRTWERVREANVSETFRDLLLRMEKVRLISGPGLSLQATCAIPCPEVGDGGWSDMVVRAVDRTSESPRPHGDGLQRQVALHDQLPRAGQP